MCTYERKVGEGDINKGVIPTVDEGLYILHYENGLVNDDTLYLTIENRRL